MSVCDVFSFLFSATVPNAGVRIRAVLVVWPPHKCRVRDRIRVRIGVRVRVRVRVRLRVRVRARPSA